MARKPTPLPAGTVSTFDESVTSEPLNELAVIEQAAQDKLYALATQLGYEGALTVGGIEDEIRFYQRRTVEALLETGKRLLLLKEAAPHGEFQDRVQLLGFSMDTAQRFMNAVKKTVKNRNLRLLASEVNSASAFLELITHDDGVIENLAEMDNFDKMSASQLRAAAREMEKANAADKQVMRDLHLQKDKLEAKLKRQQVAVTDWPAEFTGYISQVQHAHKTLRMQIGALDIVREKALALEASSDAEEAALERAKKMLAEELLSIHRQCAQYLEAVGLSFSKTLGGYADEGLYQ